MGVGQIAGGITGGVNKVGVISKGQHFHKYFEYKK